VAAIHFPRGQQIDEEASGASSRTLRLEHFVRDTRLRFVLSSHIAWQSKLPTLRLRVRPLCEEWPRIDARAASGRAQKRLGNLRTDVSKFACDVKTHLYMLSCRNQAWCSL
jgi:hypothetical protein